MSEKFAIAQHFVESNPQAAARALEELASTAASGFIDAVPDSQSIRLLTSMLPFHAAKCVSLLSTDAAARYLANLQPRNVANILRYTTHETRSRILERLPRRISSPVLIILNYSLSMVGAWLEPAVLALPNDCTVGEAKTRLQNEGYVDFHRVYVVNTLEILLGFVKLTRLLQAADDHPLDGLMEPALHTLRASTSLDAALDDPGWLESDYLPVVDRRERFLGVIRYAGLRAALARPVAANEDQDMSGTFLDLAETCYLGLAELMNTSLAVDQGTNRKREG